MDTDALVIPIIMGEISSHSCKEAEPGVYLIWGSQLLTLNPGSAEETLLLSGWGWAAPAVTGCPLEVTFLLPV